MHDDYKVSIIIPHYNSPDLLEKLLMTIPDKNEIQTIVVDDHSSEEVKERLKTLQSTYEGKDILFLENDTNEHNAGATRNIGLEKAKGEWLLFADADDYFLDGFYENIEKYFNSDYDIVFFIPTSIEIDTGSQGCRFQILGEYVEEYLINPNNLTELNLRYRWGPPWSKLIRRSMVQSNGIIFDSVRLYNDTLFSAKIGNYANKIYASKGKVYCVTRNKGSLTTKLDLESFEIQTGVKIREYQFLKEHLSKEDFKVIEAYRIAWGQLQLIWRRKYGFEVLLKYFRLFRKNKMLFDIRIFSRIKPRQWSRDRKYEKETRDRYEK